MAQLTFTLSPVLAVGLFVSCTLIPILDHWGSRPIPSFVFYSSYTEVLLLNSQPHGCALTACAQTSPALTSIVQQLW